MSLLGHPYRASYSEIEDLSYPPCRVSKVKMGLLGLLLPAFLGWHAISIWEAGEASWWLARGSSPTVVGDAARAFAVFHLGLAICCHVRWCMSAALGCRWYGILFGLGLLMVGGGLCAGVYFMVV